MKIFNKFLYLVAAISFVAVGCVKKEAPIEPGPQEVDGCYGVYFPVQDASGSHILSPTDALEMTIKLARTETQGAITVPIISEFSDDVFTVTAAEFADGQEETTFKVSFPTIEQGKTYSASFRIEDNKYASIYSSNAAGLDFSFMQVEMKDFMTEDKSQKAALTFTDNVFWGEVHDDVYLQYYEVDGVRYCETTGGKLLSPADASDGVGPWGTDVQLKFIWYTNKTIEWEGVEYQFIEVPGAFHGWQSSDGIDVWYGDYYNMLTCMGLSTGGTTSSYQYYTASGDHPCYYDGHGGFYFSLSYWISGTTRWYGFQENAPVGIADGYTRVDYTFEVESDFSDGGVAPIYITAGADVASVKYQVYEGSLNNAQINNKLEEIKDDATAVTLTDELVLDEDDNMKYAAIGITPEKSGIYTFVAIALDATGKVQNGASTVFKCITAEEEGDHAVDINVFTEDTPARYQSLHDYDSFAYCISGSGLTEVHVGFFAESTIEKYGANVVMNAVKTDAESYLVSDEDLEKINSDGGLYDVITKLAAKTTYYAVVWATNGDLEKFATASYTTDKLPYVWNSLGKGTLTDGFLMPDWSMDDVTVACDVYEEKSTPGLYMITGFQLELASLFYDVDESVLIPYEGEDGNWWNAQIVIDATDPANVTIEQQQYGIYTNGTYQYAIIFSYQPGTLADGAITFPANGLAVGYTGNGKAYLTNPNGTFKITLPSANAAPALTAPASGSSMRTDFTHAKSTFLYQPKAVYERDAQPVSVEASVIGGRRHNFNRTATEVR